MGKMHAAMAEDAIARQELGEAIRVFQDFAVRDPEQYRPLVNAVAEELQKISK
jgi:hypothetical protein